MTRLLKALMRWFRTLQAQLILWAILPVTLVIVALALTGVYSHQRAMRDFVTEHNRVLATLLARSLADELAHGYITPDGQGVQAWLERESEMLPGGIAVLDAQGHVLAHEGTSVGIDERQREEMLVSLPVDAGAVFSFIVSGSGADSVLVTLAPVSPVNWIVMIQEPVQDILGPILRFASLGPIVAGVAIGLSLLILTFGWRTIMRPLRDLSQAATQVSWGNHSAIEEEIGGVTEIRDLHAALHEMVERIEGYEAGVHDYLEAVTKGQEAERARLAREIHDGPVQGLIALSQRSEMVRRRIEEGDTDVAQTMLEDLRASEVAIVEELRRIIGALRPIYLEDLGFLPALQMLVQHTAVRADAEVNLTHEAPAPRLCSDVELAAYRIAQQALSNALQHAQAEQITVDVRYDKDEAGIMLRIIDDGVGFKLADRLDTYTQQGHFGLIGLQERARQLNGSLQIKTAPGFGTEVIAHLPDHQEGSECIV